MTLSSAPLRVLSAAASLAALVALWRYRPAWPDLPDSLSSPATTTLLQQLVATAAWLLAALLVLVLLAGNVSRRIRERRNASLSAAARSHTRGRRIQPVASHAVGVEARLVVVAREEVARDSPGEVVAALTLDNDPDPGEHPLISLLGPLTIDGAKQSRRGLRARALELIAFLALRRQGAQRDEILEALWPGEDPKRSRHRLYQAVRDARRLLGEAVASERDRYWLERHRVRIDVDELDELVNAARAGDRPRTDPLERALSLFRGQPLAGSDYAWAASEIRRLRGTHAALLELVGRGRLEAGDARGALELAERGLALDVLNEELWRLALEAEGKLGLREAIEARYRDLRALLEERLGLEPAKETRAFFLRLLSQA